MSQGKHRLNLKKIREKYKKDNNGKTLTNSIICKELEKNGIKEYEHLISRFGNNLPTVIDKLIVISKLVDLPIKEIIIKK